jgi:hypothetical protein
MRFLLAGCLVVLAGCAHKPAINTYRLVPQGVLVPPEVKSAELPQRTYLAPVAAGKGSCSVEPGPIQLQARKRKLRVTINRDALAQQKQPGWLNDWTMRLESQGCIAAGDGQKLGRSIVESVPLDSTVAFRLLHANDVQNGYVELNPENRLEVRSPILQDASPADGPVGEISAIAGSGSKINVDLKLSAAVIGFETDWYGIEPIPGLRGYRFTAISAERNIQGAVTSSATPASNYFQFSPRACYFRLFYKRDSNGVTAIVISGATRADLDARTKTIGSDPSACDRESGMCLVLPKRVGVNPFLLVTVNSKDLTVPLGATVRAAITAAGMRAPETVLNQLAITRPFRGEQRAIEFDPKTPDVLNLKLAGGETIRW